MNFNKFLNKIILNFIKFLIKNIKNKLENFKNASSSRKYVTLTRLSHTFSATLPFFKKNNFF